MGKEARGGMEQLELFSGIGTREESKDPISFMVIPNTPVQGSELKVSVIPSGPAGLCYVRTEVDGRVVDQTSDYPLSTALEEVSKVALRYLHKRVYRGVREGWRICALPHPHFSDVQQGWETAYVERKLGELFSGEGSGTVYYCYVLEEGMQGSGRHESNGWAVAVRYDEGGDECALDVVSLNHCNEHGPLECNPLRVRFSSIVDLLENAYRVLCRGLRGLGEPYKDYCPSCVDVLGTWTEKRAAELASDLLAFCAWSLWPELV